MNLDDLSHFLVLAEELHFGRASQRCHLSPSALTRVVQRLESELESPLFARDNRSVSLTPAGQRFRGRAREMLETWQAAKGELQSGDGEVAGELSLYSSVTACYSILPELLARFRTLHPEVTLKLHTGDAESALRRLADGEIDLAVAALPDHLPARLDFAPILETPLTFIAPADRHFQRNRKRIHRIDWEHEPLILPERGTARTRIDRWFADQSLVPTVYAQVAGNEAILSMVSLGGGIGVVPELVWEKSPLRSALQPLKVTPALCPYRVGICVARRRTSPASQAFWAMLQRT